MTTPEKQEAPTDIRIHVRKSYGSSPPSQHQKVQPVVAVPAPTMIAVARRVQTSILNVCLGCTRHPMSPTCRMR